MIGGRDWDVGLVGMVGMVGMANLETGWLFAQTREWKSVLAVQQAWQMVEVDVVGHVCM